MVAAARPRSRNVQRPIWSTPTPAATTLTALALSTQKAVRMRRAHGGGERILERDRLHPGLQLLLFAGRNPGQLRPGAQRRHPRSRRMRSAPCARVGWTSDSPGSARPTRRWRACSTVARRPSRPSPPANRPRSVGSIDTTQALLTTSAGELVRGAAGDCAGQLDVLPLTESGAGDRLRPGYGRGERRDWDGGIDEPRPFGAPVRLPLAGAPGSSWLPNPNVPGYAGVVQSADCTQDWDLHRGHECARRRQRDRLHQRGQADLVTAEPDRPTVGVTLPVTVTPSDLEGKIRWP